MTDACKALRRYGQDILTSDGMKSERGFMQHGTINCCRHSVNVALLSVRIASRLSLRCDTRSLVRGALLHDYFLYDWHVPSDEHKWHGFHHAAKACELAGRDFQLSPLERDIIARHMFPLTLTPPRSREGWIVCLADKLCALRETLVRR